LRETQREQAQGQTRRSVPASPRTVRDKTRCVLSRALRRCVRRRVFYCSAVRAHAPAGNIGSEGRLGMRCVLTRAPTCGRCGGCGIAVGRMSPYLPAAVQQVRQPILPEKGAPTSEQLLRLEAPLGCTTAPCAAAAGPRSLLCPGSKVFMHWFVPCLVCCLFIRYFIYYLIVTSFLYSKSGRPREDTRLLSQCWPQVMRCCVCVCVCVRGCVWLCVSVCIHTCCLFF